MSEKFPLEVVPHDGSPTCQTGDPNQPASKSNRFKIWYTAALCFVQFASGMVSGIFGPALMDMMELLHCNFNEISYSAIGRGAASFISANVAGYAYTRFNRQLGLVIIVAGCAVSVAALPWQRHLYGYFVNDAIASMFAIAMDLGCNAWMLEIWQEDANTFMLSMGFVSALGQATSTFLVTPFLSVSEELLPSNMTNATVVASPLLHIVRKSRIRIPYFISGVIALISAGAMLGLYFTSRYKQEVRTMDGKRKKNTDDVLPENEAETETSVSGERTSKCHPIMTMIAGTILVIVYFSTERNTLSYLPSFLTILDEPVDKLTASHMISTLTAVFAAANGLAILISTRVSVSHMLSGFFILIMGGNLLLVSFANTSESMIWVAVVVLGMGHSSAIPCIYSFIEQKINVTNTVVGVFMAAGSVFGVVSTMILGQLMKMYPLTLVYSNLVYISICSLILISLCIRDSGVQTKTHA